MPYLGNLCLKGRRDEGESVKVYASENVEGRGMYKGIKLRLWENENEWVSVEWEGKSYWLGVSRINGSKNQDIQLTIDWDIPAEERRLTEWNMYNNNNNNNKLNNMPSAPTLLGNLLTQSNRVIGKLKNVFWYSENTN